MGQRPLRHSAAIVTSAASARRLLPEVLGSLIALLLAVGCGGSSNSASSSASPSPSPSPSTAARVTAVDSCTLVTAADASTAVGGANLASLPTGAGAGQQSICIYGPADSSTNAAVFVLAQVYPDTSTADAVQPDQLAAAMNGQFGVTNARSVNGIGDKAFEYTATGGASNGIAIFAFKSNVVLMIVVAPATDPTKVEALARIAISNLAKAPHS